MQNNPHILFEMYQLSPIWQVNSNIYCPEPFGKIHYVIYFLGLQMEELMNFTVFEYIRQTGLRL